MTNHRGLVRLFVAGYVSAGLVLLAACGDPATSSSVDPAAAKTCKTMADSNNEYDQALWKYSKNDSPATLADAKLYLNLRASGMQDAFETSPLVMRDDVRDVSQMAELAKREIKGETDGKAGQVAYELAFDEAVQGCIAAGVPMQTFDWDSGQLQDVQPEEG